MDKNYSAKFVGNLQLKLGNFELNTGEFEIPLSGVTVLFGRSGSGKSTLLRALAGLEPTASGRLNFINQTDNQTDNQAWLSAKKSLPTEHRNIGFVFQEAALFPHKNVIQNLLYGIKRLPKGEKPADFELIVQRVGIADKLNQNIDTLSGGERQRVAIARALLMRPKLLFMDEPLSALDWRAKAEMLSLIEDLIAEFKIPVVYITHAPAEVERLADRVVFMEQGKIASIESLQQALSRADSPLFEQGAVAVVYGQPGLVADGLQQFMLGEQQLWIPPTNKTGEVRVRLLARDISIALDLPTGLSIMNLLKVQIVELIPMDDFKVLARLQLIDNPQQIFAELTQFSTNKLQLQPGLVVHALIKSIALAE